MHLRNQIAACPHCGNRVWFPSDGTCPTCGIHSADPVTQQDLQAIDAGRRHRAQHAEHRPPEEPDEEQQLDGAILLGAGALFSIVATAAMGGQGTIVFIGLLGTGALLLFGRRRR